MNPGSKRFLAHYHGPSPFGHNAVFGEMGRKEMVQVVKLNRYTRKWGYFAVDGRGVAHVFRSLVRHLHKSFFLKH